LDLRAFYEPYEGNGRRNQPFDPQMMVTCCYAQAEVVDATEDAPHGPDVRSDELPAELQA
jgi:hypothetical protein